MTLLNTFWPIMAATLAVIVLAGLGLSLGMLFGRPPPRGSCGGLASGACACATVERPARCQPAGTESAPSADVRYPSGSTWPSSLTSRCWSACRNAAPWRSTWR